MLKLNNCSKHIFIYVILTTVYTQCLFQILKTTLTVQYTGFNQRFFSFWHNNRRPSRQQTSHIQYHPSCQSLINRNKLVRDQIKRPPAATGRQPHRTGLPSSFTVLCNWYFNRFKYHQRQSDAYRHAVSAFTTVHLIGS